MVESLLALFWMSLLIMGTGVEVSKKDRNNGLKTTPDESPEGSWWTKFHFVVFP